MEAAGEENECNFNGFYDTEELVANFLRDDRFGLLRQMAEAKQDHDREMARLHPELFGEYEEIDFDTSDTWKDVIAAILHTAIEYSAKKQKIRMVTPPKVLGQHVNFFEKVKETSGQLLPQNPAYIGTAMMPLFTEFWQAYGTSEYIRAKPELGPRFRQPFEEPILRRVMTGKSTDFPQWDREDACPIPHPAKKQRAGRGTVQKTLGTFVISVPR